MYLQQANLQKRKPPKVLVLQEITFRITVKNLKKLNRMQYLIVSLISYIL